jgi:hypothetical protein
VDCRDVVFDPRAKAENPPEALQWLSLEKLDEIEAQEYGRLRWPEFQLTPYLKVFHDDQGFLV